MHIKYKSKSKSCHGCNFKAWKAKVEGSHIRLYKAKEGRRRKEDKKPPKYPWGALTLQP